jgi:hypothetical protein
VNDHRTDSTIQKAYGDHSTKQANARPPYQSAVELSSSSSSSDSDDESNIQLMGNPDFFFPGDDKTLGESAYKRVIPVRFESDDDDIFMRSMYENYAYEEKTPKTKTDAGGAPTGHFWMVKTQAYAAAQEVLSTHKGMSGAALQKYLDTYFEKAWGHFDVNLTG